MGGRGKKPLDAGRSDVNDYCVLLCRSCFCPGFHQIRHPLSSVVLGPADRCAVELWIVNFDVRAPV